MLDVGQNPFNSDKCYGSAREKMGPEFCQMSGGDDTKSKDGLCRMRLYFSSGPVLYFGCN